MTGHGDERRPHGGVEPESADLLRAQAEQVDPAVAEQLGAMRRAAVAEMDREYPAARRRVPVLLAGLGAAAAALAVTVALLLPPAAGPGPEALLLAEADEIAAVSELEVLEELEFLAWLEEEGLDAGQG